MKIFLSIIISILLLIYPANNADAAVSLSTTADTSTTHAKAGCEYAVPLNINETDYVGHPLENPDSIASQSGSLNTTIEVKYANNRIADCDVHLRSYNGSLVGPTLRVHPGDTININLINDLPPEQNPPAANIDLANFKISKQSSDGCSYEEQTSANNVPHNFNTTNFHTHGLHVDPNACSDNVLRVMAPKEQAGASAPEYTVEVRIPEDHPSGTFWYHAHLHGSTALQVSSGMAGALIIEGGGLDLVPEIAAANEHEKIFMFQQIAYDDQGEIEDYDNFGPGTWADLGRHTTINGQILPVITMRPGEIQRWRFIHGGVRESLNLELRNNNNRQIPLHEIAVDGIPLGKLDSWRYAPIELEPGYRSDVLVKAPQLRGKQSSQTYNLIDQATSNQRSLLGTGEAGHILATVVVEGEPMMMDLPDNSQLAEAKQNDAPDDIADDEITNSSNPQLVSFSVDPQNFQFMVNGEPFDPNNIRPLELDKAEIWNLETATDSVAPSHPFHIHVNPFQHDRKGPGRRTERIWRDTLLITQGSPQEIRTRYDEFTGKFVLHCHILDHEDQGMMQVVQITD